VLAGVWLRTSLTEISAEVRLLYLVGLQEVDDSDESASRVGELSVVSDGQRGAVTAATPTSTTSHDVIGSDVSSGNAVVSAEA